MKFLLINASPHNEGTSKLMLKEAAKVFEDGKQEVKILDMGNDARYPCTACGACKRDGKCRFGDLDEIILEMRSAGGIIFATPTHYANACGSLISALSRICFSAKDALENKPAAAFASARRAGSIGSIEEIGRFFAFSSAITVNGIYPPHLYGGERDIEGLAYARSVAENMLWIAKCIEAAKKNGVLPPRKINAVRVNI